MTIYVVLHHGEIDRAFRSKKDACNYAFDGDVNEDEFSILEAAPENGGEWNIVECSLE